MGVQGKRKSIRITIPIINFLYSTSPCLHFQDLKHTLALELDFENEAKNAERCARDMKCFSYIYVPKVHWDKTTKV